jgi:predicted transposase/invertase (TIGR01784 family)
MKTDSLFYRLFQRSPSIFFELMGQPGVEAIGYEFRSVEIKQTAFRIDGVLLPISKTAEAAADRPVYFSEVQFQRDQQLYQRFFAEIFLYLAQHPTTYDWQGVLIYPSRSVEPTESRLYQFLLESSKVSRVYLDELGAGETLSLGVGIAKLVIEPEQTAPAQARQLIERSQREQIAGISSQEIIDLVETIIVYKFNNLSRKEIEAMLGLGELKQTRVYQEALEEGRQEGRQELVESVLKAKFGSLDAALSGIIPALLALPAAEFTPLLLQASRQELLDRFVESDRDGEK